MKRALGVLLLNLVLAQTIYAQEIEVIPANAKLEGTSLGDWGGRWWQWALQFDKHNSPVSDITGENCANRQTGNVWFLAGAYTRNSITRTCEIPQGKTLFFPILNVVHASTQDQSITCERAKQGARSIMQSPTNLYLSIDGKKISDVSAHREASKECFDPYKLFARSQELKTSPPGFPAASDGYWIAIKPLPVGKHTLRFGGQVPSFSQDITYELTVR